MNKRRRQNERGAILPLLAVSLATIMAFAALVVDVGNVTNIRRADQIIADQAALAAAQDLGDIPAVVSTAIEYANRNTTEGQFSVADFDSCTGATQPPRFSPVTGTNCIAINDAGTEVRVILPLRSSDTVFGSIIGVDAFDHTAEATAALVPLGYGNVLPFGLGYAAEGTVCLKVGAGNVPDADCNDNASGNFGFINFGFYGNSAVGTAEDCSGNGKNGRLQNNLAVGADHDISLYGSGTYGTSIVYDSVGSNCGEPYPNGSDTVTGNVPTAFGTGIYAGTEFSDGDPARLQRGGADWGSGPVTTSIAGYNLDDVPLWEYIGDLSGTDVPRSCWKDQFGGDDGILGNDDDFDDIDPGVALHLQSATPEDRMVKLIERCVVHYGGEPWTDKGAFVLDNYVDFVGIGEPPTGCFAPLCTDPVFNANSAIDVENKLWDIQYSPRFGYIPELNLDSSSLNGNTSVYFTAIRPVFIQRIFGGSCTSHGCSFIFDPGFGLTYNGSTSAANAMTAFVIPSGMLPGDLGATDGAFAVGVNRFVQLVG